MNSLEVLQKYWNYDNFRNLQEEIIQAVLQKNDVVALLPTGGGKSVCYQIPALIFKGTCVVISPLIALMQDQINSLTKKGIKAIAITSKLTQSEIVIAFDNLRFGNTKFLYLSPEKLQSDFIQSKLKQLNIDLIAVDEAHCISEWGHDFRQNYLNISILREIQPKANIIALTATATPKVENDIIENLKLVNVKQFKKTFKRDNLAYQVFKTEDILYKLKRILNKINKPTIIYVNSRNQTKTISNYLNQNQFISTYYNGGMTIEAKEKAFNNWMNENKKIIVATNAFGMGIDKDNVAIVIHLDLPNSIENYIQEAGRAGRNGKKAFSVILYNENTILDFSRRVNKSIIEIDFLKKVYFLLNQYFQIALGELTNTNYEFDIQDFTTKYKFDVLKTYNAIQILEKEGILLFEQNYYRKSNVQFCSTNKTVLDFTKKHKSLKPIIQLLLRSYGGVFNNKTNINESFLASKLNTEKLNIITQLKQLDKSKIINYESQSSINQLRFLVMREDNNTINKIAKNVKQRNKLKKNKTGVIINYVKNNHTCRSVQLLSYFSEKNLENCGICEVCLSSKKTKLNLNLIGEKIISIIKNNQQLDAKEIVILLNEKEGIVLKTLQILLEKNLLKLNLENKYEQA